MARLKIRDEEHRALQGLLPPELFSRVVSLNVASRERGGDRIVTAAAVKQLGTEAVAKAVAVRDPRLAAAAIAREVATRIVARARQEGAERER